VPSRPAANGPLAGLTAHALRIDTGDAQTLRVFAPGAGRGGARAHRSPLRLVRDELALPLHRAVERGKVQLSTGATGRLALAELGLDLPLDRARFDDWIADELAAIDDGVAAVLRQAGVTAAEVDTVFATGGSSLVPAVRQRLAARFGAAKLAGGEELTSVAWGLAARARQVFG